MVNVTIIDTIKTKELDNGKFMTTHKAQDEEANQYTFNFFGQPLKLQTKVELEKLEARKKQSRKIGSSQTNSQV
jgi:hypothetical protein